MRGFEARNLRFCSVRDIGILDENVILMLKVRHIVYLLFAALLVFASYGRSQVIAVFVAALAVIAAFYPAKAVSFEAYMYGLLFNSIPSRKRLAVKLEKAKPGQGAVDAGIDGFAVSRSDEEEAPNILLTRTKATAEILKKETRKF